MNRDRDAVVEDILLDVLRELGKAEAKFPGQHLESGTGPGLLWLAGLASNNSAKTLATVLRDRTNDRSEDGLLTWRDMLLEELAEAFAESDPAKLRAELLQVAAMAVRWIGDLDNPQPVYFTAPSGRAWREVGRDVDGLPVVTLVPYSERMRQLDRS